MKWIAKLFQRRREPTIEDLIGGSVIDLDVSELDPTEVEELKQDMESQIAEIQRRQQASIDPTPTKS